MQTFALAASLNIACAADTTSVFNEVMYHPAGAEPEWIELRNQLAINMDLSGWTITGGVNFTFPESTVIPAGGYLLVSANPAALQSVTGVQGVLGPWTGALNNAGETIRLRDRARRVMDELSYGDDGGWPVGADGSGMSLARKSGHVSGAEPEHWVASTIRGGTPGGDNFAPKLGPPQQVFGFGDPWLYHDTSSGFAGGWSAIPRTIGTDGWLSGNGVLAFEADPLPSPVGTVLANPASHPTGTYYFQKQFAFSGTPSSAHLTLRSLVDDGAVIYLNGQEVARRRMPGGAIAATTPASEEVVNTEVAEVSIPTAALVNGTNTLSVEVHQAGVPLKSAASDGGLTLSGLTLVQTGGAIFPTNYARQAGATAFAKDVLGNGSFAPTHTIANLNNGTFGNGSSWIGDSLNSFCGISFGSTPMNLGRVAWGRDNTGGFVDRTAGLFTLEFTAVANPGASTPATGNPATGWAVIGTASYPSDGSPYSLRHAFSFPAVLATGIRLTVPGEGISGGACIDELEAGPPAADSAVFKLMATGGSLDASTDLAIAGTAFAKDVIAGVPAHSIPHLNDGLYGNSFSWIGGSADSFCGIAFSSARSIGRLGFGRDNTGTFTDRTFGDYVIQYTTVANPSAATPDDSWTTIGTLTIGGALPFPSRRHVFEFAPVSATGIRIRPPSGACIDELELYAPVAPDVVWGAALELREIISQPAQGPLRISEIAGTNAANWQIELQNTGAAPLDVGGVIVASSGMTGGFTLPTQTVAPGAWLVLDQAALGFRPNPGDRIFVYSPGGASLIDAVAVRTTTRARDSLGRMLVPAQDSFGTSNSFEISGDIVINEVMYHFPPFPSTPTTPVTSNPEEWIELHNRGEAAVNLEGWSLERGINFVFPAGASIPAGGYLVVAKDAAALATKWPEHTARIIGNFSGSLSNSGETILLKDGVGNPADEVRYYTGGAWPELPDGGGASLELRNPWADRRNGASWATSMESGGAWQNTSYTMVAGQTFGQPPLWNEFRIGMLEAGECLVDDVSVIRVSNGQQLIQGGDFSSLTNKWRLLGNHGTSSIGPEPGNPGNTLLHVRASGQFGWNHNHIETTFAGNTALMDGQSYTVSFRARWLGGTNQLNTRGYFSRLAKTTELTLPTRLGSPGAQNSRYAPNLGPALSALAHSPIVPAPGQAVSVTVKANDPDGISALTLRYALNGSAGFASVPMVETDGTYSAEIPGQAGGTIVQFYVDATDGLGATSRLPAAGPNSRALYLVDNGAGSPVSAHELRIIMLPADRLSLLAPLNRLSEGRLGGTAVFQRAETFYDAGIRLQGTAAGRIRDGELYPGYDIGFPRDRLFRGLHDSVNIDRSGRAPTVRGQDEIYVKHLFHRAGVPATYDDLIYLIAPDNVHTGTAILLMSGYEGTFVDSQFDGDGTVFNLDGTYEPSTTTDGNVESLKNPVPLAVQVHSDFTNLGADKEQYRGQLEPRSGKRRDDFAGLIAFCQTMALPNAQLATQIGGRMDVDQWMRVAAIYSLWGIGDCYMNAGFNHNLRVHVPSDGSNVRALPWDMDFVMSASATAPAILAGGNLLRVINQAPGARRAYFSHLHELCTTQFTSAYFTPWLEHYGSVVGQTMTGTASYIEARRNHLLAQLPANTAFAITTNGGADFSVNAASTVLAGSGWINIREIRRSDTGAALELTWTTDTNWQAPIALNFGANELTLTAYDHAGAVVGSDSITITSTLAAPLPRDFLRITELHYRPALPSTPEELAVSADANDFEFIELRNFSTENLDVSACRFTAGVAFTFAAGTSLAPGETIHVVKHVAAFQARYGTGPRVAGAYGPANSLNNDGETITLEDAFGIIIQSFTYNDAFPWPTNADGGGHSLVAIAPHLPLDRNNAANWRASVAIGGSPGTTDTVTFTGNPEPDQDRDGLNAFLEYALGTSDESPDLDALTLTRESGGSIALTFTARLNADDVALTLETCAALPAFGPANATLIASAQDGEFITQTWRVTPAAGGPGFFARLRATSR